MNILGERLLHEKNEEMRLLAKLSDGILNEVVSDERVYRGYNRSI